MQPLSSSEAAIEELISSFEIWLEETGRSPMTDDEESAVWEEIWGGLT